MSDPNFTEKHYRAVSIAISEPEYIKNNNLLTPFCVARVVTENGGIWSIQIGAFGASKELVAKAWEDKPSQFTKVKN